MLLHLFSLAWDQGAIGKFSEKTLEAYKEKSMKQKEEMTILSMGLILELDF